MSACHRFNKIGLCCILFHMHRYKNVFWGIIIRKKMLRLISNDCISNWVYCFSAFWTVKFIVQPSNIWLLSDIFVTCVWELNIRDHCIKLELYRGYILLFLIDVWAEQKLVYLWRRGGDDLSPALQPNSTLLSRKSTLNQGNVFLSFFLKVNFFLLSTAFNVNFPGFVIPDCGEFKQGGLVDMHKNESLNMYLRDKWIRNNP